MTRTVRPARLDPRSPLVLDVHELGRRPGAMHTVERTVPAPTDLGSAVLAVPERSELRLTLRLESVMEGVLVSGEAEAAAAGECVRCLDPVEVTVVAPVQELFRYAPREGPDSAEEPEAGDEAELPLLDGDLLDVEPTVRDSLVPALPFRPICRPDCPGLCPRCGERLADSPGHSHDETDPRWQALAGLAGQLAESVTADEPARPAAAPAAADRPAPAADRVTGPGRSRGPAKEETN